VRSNISQSVLLRILAVAAVGGCAARLLGRSVSQSSHHNPLATTRETTVQSPNVFVENQAGSPLRIVLVEIKTEPGTTELVFELTNTSTKLIRAYAIQQKVASGEKQRKESVFNDLSLAGLSLSPESSRKEITTIEVLDPKPTIALSVDFVEFADGSTWGIDNSASAERLKGQRTGFKSLNNLYSETYKKEGAVGLTKALESASQFSPVPDGYSSEWKAGFRTGQRIAAGRLKKTLEAGDTKKVEALIKRDREKQ
jgi:hypothetical protein